MSEAAVTEPTGQQQEQQPSGATGSEQQQSGGAQQQDNGGGGDTALAGARDETAKAWDNWRQDVSGGDEKLLGELSRYKSPVDLGKALQNAQQTIAKRREPLTLAKDATPEQVAEYRKAVGVPDHGTLKGYGIEAPQGYELSEVEKGALEDLARTAHAAHLPASAVKTVSDVFFRSQAANQQALNKLDGERSKAWQTELRSEFGKDFEPLVSAAEAFLTDQFKDNPEGRSELLNARLPGGGKLGDHPVFIRMMVDAALKGGFADRIEANEIEIAGGKSLAEQHHEIERLQHTDRQRYNLPDTQVRLDKIIAARVARGELDDQGNEIRRRA